VITAFQPATLKKMTALVENYLIEGEPKPTTSPTKSILSAEEAGAIAGSYQRITRRFIGVTKPAQSDTLQVINQSGALADQQGNNELTTLLPVARYLFRRADDVGASLFIGPGDDGEVYFQRGSDNFRRISPRETGGE